MLRICLLVGWGMMVMAAEIAPGISDPGIEARAKLKHQYLHQYFTIGIDAPVEWCIETREQQGAKWDFRMQYFSGGAGWDGTKASWDTVFLHKWNKWVNPEKRKGVWADTFIQESSNNGFIPWICFYNLAQSRPADYKPGPAKATPVNMRNKETMRAYWEQVKLVMERAAVVAPKPVVIQVEPDEWGHMLLGSPSFDGEAVPVQVGSSGMPDVAGLEDNLRGYSLAWLKLRALYAPNNVILLANPSAWDQNGRMTGANWARIFKQCHVDKWDGAILETGDRDIGCVPGKGAAPPYGELTTTGSHFNSIDEQLRWIETFHQETGLPVYFWQAAVGNTYFRTCNQTEGHFADMLAQALLEDYPKNPMIARYVQAGCWGWVFSNGQPHQTAVYDRRKDGITNPPPIPGNLGHESTFADDDGGYMRLRGGAYYAQPYPIKAGTPLPVSDAEARAAKAAAAAEKKAAREAKRQEREAARAAAKADADAWSEAATTALPTWLALLQERATAAAGGRRPPRFTLVMMRQEVELIAVEDSQAKLKIPSMGSEMTYPLFAKLDPQEGLELALACCTGGTPEDHAIIAFFARRAGDKEQWRSHQVLAGETFQALLAEAFGDE